jgi:hypothetical protein
MCEIGCIPHSDKQLARTLAACEFSPVSGKRDYRVSAFCAVLARVVTTLQLFGSGAETDRRAVFALLDGHRLNMGGGMHFRSLWIFSGLICSASLADEASHREAAFRVLEITKAEKSMQTGLQSMVDPIVASMRQGGMPESAAQEVKGVISEWFAQEMRWADLKPKIADVYVQQFTEVELNELYAFYQTPTGQKALEKLPTVTKLSSEISSKYIGTKQESLKLKLKQVAEKYAPKKGQ